MWPNFIRHVIGVSVQAKEEGVTLGVIDFLRICDVKPNSSTWGTYYLSPRPHVEVLKGTPAKEDKWKEKYFFFTVHKASVGDRVWVPMNWATGAGSQWIYFSNSVSLQHARVTWKL